MNHKAGNENRRRAELETAQQQAIADRRFIVGDLTPEQEEELERQYRGSERFREVFGREPGD